jgi:DNA end-binding protein Ku
MRAIWKGYIKFSLVTIPVKVFKATKSGAIQFNLLHAKCRAPLKIERKCAKCGSVVGAEEIVRGYKYGKDQYVVVTDSDFEKVAVESTHTINIAQFVKEEEIDPIYFDESYYIAPDGSAAIEAYTLLRKIMEREGKIAIAKVVIRNKEQLVAIRPYKNAFVLSTMFYPKEVKGVDELGEIEGVEIQAQEINLAHQLVKNFSRAFNPDEYRDEYTQKLLEIINAKISGKEVEAPKPEVGKVLSLMEALKQSVEQSATMAKARRRKVVAEMREMAKVEPRKQIKKKRRKEQ